MDKNSFVMYTTYAEHINLLTMEQRGLLFTAIMNYASGEPLPDMDGMTRMAFSFIKVQMDRDSEKYQATVEKRRESGKLGGRPSTKANGFSEKAKKAKDVAAGGVLIFAIFSAIVGLIIFLPKIIALFR